MTHAQCAQNAKYGNKFINQLKITIETKYSACWKRICKSFQTKKKRILKKKTFLRLWCPNKDNRPFLKLFVFVQYIKKHAYFINTYRELLPINQT